MSRISKIDSSVRRVGESGVFHDSRRDVRTLAVFCNMLKEKINELIDENQKLKEQVQKLTTPHQGG